MKKTLLILIITSFIPLASAKDKVYQTPEDFLATAFGTTPDPERITLSGDLGKELKKFLGIDIKKFVCLLARWMSISMDLRRDW